MPVRVKCCVSRWRIRKITTNVLSYYLSEHFVGQNVLGGVPEWSNGTVLKTVASETGP